MTEQLNAVQKYKGIVQVEDLLNKLGLMNEPVQKYINTQKVNLKPGAITLLNKWKTSFETKIDSIPEFEHEDEAYQEFINEKRNARRNPALNRLREVNTELVILNG